MSDDDAYMALALCNAQGELHPLEVGLHALHSGLTIREYADRTSISKSAIGQRQAAAEVSTHVDSKIDPDRWRHLAEFHAAERRQTA